MNSIKFACQIICGVFSFILILIGVLGLKNNNPKNWFEANAEILKTEIAPKNISRQLIKYTVKCIVKYYISDKAYTSSTIYGSADSIQEAEVIRAEILGDSVRVIYVKKDNINRIRLSLKPIQYFVRFLVIGGVLCLVFLCLFLKIE